MVLYYDEKSERRYHTLGWASDMNKGTADEKRQEFMREINGGGRTTGTTRPPTVKEFLEQVYLPFYRAKWKESTAGTSENRLQHHIAKELGGEPLEDLTLAPPVGPHFDVRDGSFRKGDLGKPDRGALHPKDSETEREPDDVR